MNENSNSNDLLPDDDSRFRLKMSVASLKETCIRFILANQQVQAHISARVPKDLTDAIVRKKLMLMR